MPAALGIPDREAYGTHAGLRPGMVVPFVEQIHMADRAGCFTGSTRILTSRGYERISDLHKGQANRLVLSADVTTGEVSWKPVLNWFKHSSTTDWYQINFLANNGFTVTGEHTIYIFKKEKLIPVRASDLKISDQVACHDFALSEDQKDFLMGSFLGDGSVGLRHQMRPKFTWGQNAIHSVYAHWAASLFSSSPEVTHRKNGSVSYYFRFAHAYLRKFADAYIPKKTVPDFLLHSLTAKALAVWFMDDGQWSHPKSLFLPLSRNKKRRKNAGTNSFSGTVYLYTNGFTSKENAKLASCLNNKFKLPFHLRYRGNYTYLSMSGISNNKRFFSLVAPYIHSGMQYKCPLPVGSYKWEKASPVQKALFPVPVTKTFFFQTTQNCRGKIYPAKVSRFDLEVAETHTYFVSDILVSNSHSDIRLGNNEGGLLSWAVRKGLPAPGEKHLGIRQPLHAGSYADFQGEIKEGYGKGMVELARNGKALITGVDQDGVSFSTADERYPQRFRLQKTPKGWLLVNTTDTKPRDYVKEKMRTLPQERAAETFSDQNVVQPKLDGAAIFIENLKNRLEASSYRTSKVTGGPLLHSERAGLYREKPFAPAGTVLRGELYGTSDGKTIHPSKLGGLLNSSIGKSLTDQSSQNIQLRTALYDIIRHGSKDVSTLPYEDRLSLLKGMKLPSSMEVMQGETDPKAQKALWDQIRAGRHPLTSEGVVAHPLGSAGPATKVPVTPEFDVIIKKIVPSTGEKGNPGVALEYALPDNPDVTVGKVGGGFSAADREDMLANPDAWIGRTARVRAKEQMKSGALRAPAFLARHEG